MLTESEVQELLDLRDYRNEAAHELPALLVDINKVFDFKRYIRLGALLGKIDRWRVRLNIDCDEDLAGLDIKDGEIRSGSMILGQVINQMVLRLAGADA